VKYTLTGNFQYDLGIYGLKKIFDFFDEEYRTDGKFYIEIDKRPEEILELIFLYRFLHAKEKFKDIFDEIRVDIGKVTKHNLKRFSDLEKLEGFGRIKRKFFKKLALLFQNEYLNLVNPSKTGSISSFKDLANVILKNIETFYGEKNVCSFCSQNEGVGINRMYFLFAPSHLNAFWSGKPSVFICKYCAVANLSAVSSLIFLRNRNRIMSLKNAVVVYRPNLDDLARLNEGLEITDIGELTERVIDYEKLILKQEAATKDLQIIEFYFDSKNPYLEFYMLTDEVIDDLLKISDNLKTLYKVYKDFLWGQVKDKTVSISKELLKYLTQNQKLFYLVQQFSKLALMAENYRQNNVKNPPVKGFYISVLLEILRIHFMLEEGLDMNLFEAFKEYGQFLRKRIYSQLSEGREVNWNTFNNKIISLANSFLDASKGSFDHFMETLTRVVISYNAPIDADLLSMLNKDTYREVSTVIALSLVTDPGSKGKESPKQKEEVVKGKLL